MDGAVSRKACIPAPQRVPGPIDGRREAGRRYRKTAEPGNVAVCLPYQRGGSLVLTTSNSEADSRWLNRTAYT